MTRLDTWDPYFDNTVCIERLMKEYLEHNKLIIAFDFDDTLFDFHKRGFTYPRVTVLLQRAQDVGFYLVLFTGGHESGWQDILDKLDAMGIKPASINKNPIPLPFGNHGKPYYNLLLDDRAGLGQAAEILHEVLTRVETIQQLDAISKPNSQQER